MAQSRNSEFVTGDNVTLEVYVEGTGPALVVLPSYGRDGGTDFDYFANKVASAGFSVVRPQPRGIAGSVGPMEDLTLHHLAADIASVIRQLADGKAIVLGHAFGHAVARTVAADYPLLVEGVILAAAQCSSVAPDISRTLHVAGDVEAPVEERLAALKKGYFARGHDPSAWLQGWYPETMRMQMRSVARSAVDEISAKGEAPVLEIIPDSDPFKPREYWTELRDQLGDRVTTAIIADAGHALFPEQPDGVADVVIAWCRRINPHV